ncbi:MAG: DUF1275 domain-containing protein [Phycisphaeraceae bacterium]|nr:DUF1275 domain-containing protein [Phycisphaerales bacterium]MCB9861540.1 DUF1275 domain-containing protein [Phycisphaeraceae bacterium]
MHHSHEHDTAPPAWVFIGGGILASVAGFVNAVVLSAGHFAVTHLTGTVSRFSGDLVSGNASHGITLLSISVGFIIGAAVSGALIGHTSLQSGRPYGIAMLLEAAMLASAALTLNTSPGIALPVAACAAGVQNAMASSYGRLILRTTHITGIATDIGLLLGHALRGRRLRAWKFVMLITLLASFFVGGIGGWRAASVFDGKALFMPAGILFLMGLSYLLWRLQHPDHDDTMVD